MDLSAESPQTPSKKGQRAAARADKQEQRAVEARRDQPKRIEPKTANQAKLLRAMQEFPVVFALGPAGTGKTYLAVRHAQNQLLGKRTSGISLSRVASSPARHRSGFLPGGPDQKIAPWIVPMRDSLEQGSSANMVKDQMSKGLIQVESFEFMRGKTFIDRHIILDEAQNCSFADLELMITRLGEKSTIVICGDPDQCDIADSGLLVFADIASNSGVNASVVRFTEDDVVRSGVAAEWVKAISAHRRSGQPMIAR